MTEELPYEAVMRDAGRDGRVLHREHIYGSGPPVDDTSEEILHFVRQHAGGSILDVGCGMGAYVGRLKDEGRSCVGIDIDPSAIELGQEKGRDLRVMSAYDLGFPDASFDTVIMIETLEHLDRYERALEEALRVARRNLVITVPDISVLPMMSKRAVVPWHLLEATHVNFFTPESLLKTLLRHASRCEVTTLVPFFEVDGETAHMHIGAIAEVGGPLGRLARRAAGKLTRRHASD